MARTSLLAQTYEITPANTADGSCEINLLGRADECDANQSAFLASQIVATG
jgi:hypothetical protein